MDYKFEKPEKLGRPESALAKKHSVTLYNHVTRESKNVPYEDKKNVIRDQQVEEDAYSRATKEAYFDAKTRIAGQMKVHDIRNRVAIKKQHVEKEFKDTLAFLNSLPKDKPKPIENDYKLEQHQLLQKESQRRLLQQEYKKIEKECKKHTVGISQSLSPNRKHSRSPMVQDLDDSFSAKDFQYTWMPVLESDSSAVHTIPTTLKENNSGSTVQFSKVDYHEYRSKHKHTPPIKDTPKMAKPMKVVETVIIEQNDKQPILSSESPSEKSCVDNFRLEWCKLDERKSNEKKSDEETVIIYKIYNANKLKTSKTKEIKIKQKNVVPTKAKHKSKTDLQHKRNNALEKLDEGVRQESGNDRQTNTMTQLLREERKSIQHKCVSTDREKESKCVVTTPSACTSTSSFKTASNDKAIGLKENGFVKFVDDRDHEGGKFYIGASGFLKNENYEVIIQLKKKDGSNKDHNITPSEDASQEKSAENEIQENGDNDIIDSGIQSSEKAEKPPRTDSIICAGPLSNEMLQDVPEQSCNGSVIPNVHVSVEQPICETFATVAYADPIVNLAKMETTSKPIVSICTQTSFDTPSQVPVLIHMSSTTSTAYMSPPELVLPKFLKNNHIINTSGFHVGEEYSYPKRLIRKTRSRAIVAPPNWSSSTQYSSKSTSTPRDAFNYSVKKKKFRTQREKVTRSETRKIKKSKSTIMHTEKKTMLSKHDLSPLVKWYVDKLLTLNREGQIAIDIVNQECSAVATPGSSIVEERRNLGPAYTFLNQNLCLQQLKRVMTRQVLEKYIRERKRNIKKRNLWYNRKVIHKVKSLNISKQFLRKTSSAKHELKLKKPNSMQKLNKGQLLKPDYPKFKKISSSNDSQETNTCIISKGSSPLPRVTADNNILKCKTNSYELITTKNEVRLAKKTHNDFVNEDVKALFKEYGLEIDKLSKEAKRSTCNENIQKQKIPTTTSTQTCQTLDDEINFIKMAEGKLQNMEKIADLTEVCTKRLSSLAKVLEEVRTNKSLSYNKIASSESDTRSENSIDNQYILLSYEPVVEITEMKSASSTKHRNHGQNQSKAEIRFVPFLKDVSTPDVSKPSSQRAILKTSEEHIATSRKNFTLELSHCKGRGRPPPALSRRNFKHCQDIGPHELSTVIEMESPLSMKVKTQPLKNDGCISCTESVASIEIQSSEDAKQDASITAQRLEADLIKLNILPSNNKTEDPDLLKRNINLSLNGIKQTLIDLRDDTKISMMDMKQFNDIMLKPFISIQEYAKQFSLSVLAEGSKLEDVPKDNRINDEISSLYSEGSLPDVIAELLKRNIIYEPFKYDTVSNSTTISSESTLSLLALSKICKQKKKSYLGSRNKENLFETSDSLSVSSYPDLENALKKLGIGWASSTLKKTKERLALSSSSNTSTSSLPDIKTKGSTHNKDVQVTSSDIGTNVLGQPLQGKTITFNDKNEYQQTPTICHSKTIKEFLNNELAKKITFTNKTLKDDCEEFVSLYETKLPEEMKRMLRPVTGHSMASPPSSSNNRARTSTPVQIYKSVTYHTSSSSNLSNVLFSNADLSSVKGTSNSQQNHSTSGKDDLTIPNCSLKLKKELLDCSE